jgi:hypothetical protein
MSVKPGIVAIACLSVGLAHAQIRPEPNAARFVDTNPNAIGQALFGPNGYFMIAGGVVLAGTASFYLETAGSDQLVPAAAVTPVANADGSVTLAYAGNQYPVGMPKGLACPLGRFVERDGFIAYTVPRFMDVESRREMTRVGLKHHRVAKEFENTAFETLLHAADFAAAQNLPDPVADRLMAGLNGSNGLTGFVVDAADSEPQAIGSLVNTDAQVRYHVYLVSAKNRVEIGGVPLRYFWQLDRGGAAGVFAVQAFAQNWQPGTTLTDFSLKNAQPSQYDIVNFYQVAGMMRQLNISNHDKFKAFVDQACHGETWE